MNEREKLEVMAGQSIIDAGIASDGKRVLVPRSELRHMPIAGMSDQELKEIIAWNTHHAELIRLALFWIEQANNGGIRLGYSWYTPDWCLSVAQDMLDLHRKCCGRYTRR